MVKIERKVVLEFLGGPQTFTEAYSIQEIHAKDCRYICSVGIWSVYADNATGSYLIAKE